MKIPVLAQIREIEDLRSVWKDEARDFTPWLASEAGLNLISEALGLELIDIELESSVGAFKADISAIDENSGLRVIIENQLEASNHDHLGKLITYASGKGAKILVWIVKEAREEHKAAVEWLNNHTDNETGIFLCEIKLFQIEDSKLVPRLEVIEKPNDWLKTEKSGTQESESKKYSYRYWSEFLDFAKTDKMFTSFFTIPRPNQNIWQNFSTGHKQVLYEAVIHRKSSAIRVGIYVVNDREFYEHAKTIDTSLNLRTLKGPHKIFLEKKFYSLDENREEQYKWIARSLIEIKKLFQPEIDRWFR